MLDTLRAWLNGKREYWAGVVLYSKLGDDARLKQLFAKGPTEFTTRRMQEELLSICRDLKKQNNGTTSLQESTTTASKIGNIAGPQRQSNQTKSTNATTNRDGDSNPAVVEECTNPDLFKAAKAEADRAYKAMMNKRAVLFSLAPLDDRTELNTPDRIAARQQLCIDIVKEHEHVSQLYDKADHAKKFGRLPGVPDPEEDELNVDTLPDHLVKQTLDNTRKNYNKMKNRDQTAERVELMQKHKSNIEKLEARWHLLKQK